MRLKRLEMLGFKSFAQKTVIELPAGITAVVGPNGCGKSNIVDALRWAMGEQSARHLRGQQMEDVVFNGSDSLPATGMAEVSLTFDNEDGRGPAEYSSFPEIMVTRRLFRSGDSEYAINKVPCRLKDVVELFLGTGVGSKAYSIVEQGRVDELVNSKPEERRALIEEAAGTSKYKSRKLVAERKLERTQQNLLRVSDIVREIERQIRSMELQAKKAERFRALRAELKDKELTSAALQCRALNQEMARCEAELADVENRIVQCMSSLHAKEAESEAIRLSLMEADKAIGAQQEDVYERKVQIQADEQRIDFYKRDLSRLGPTEMEAAAALLQLEDKLNTIANEIVELSKAKENYVQLSLFEETFLNEKERELATIEARIQTLQVEIDSEKSALIEIANQIAYSKNDSAAKEKRRAEIDVELTRSAGEHDTALKALALCEDKRRETEAALRSSLGRARDRALESAEVNASIQSLSTAKEEQERKVEALKEQIQETRSRLLSLEDLQKNYEGYQEGVRAIMLKRRQEAAPDGIYGLVAEVIEAPEPYEKALTAVLGDRLQYVIVKGQDQGVEAIEYLKKEASGRGSFIPRELSRKQDRPLPLGEAEVVAPLLEMISVKDGYADVAQYLLADVVVVRDLKSGLALWNRNGFYSTLVTPEGEVIDPMGIVTGGSGASLDGSLLTQRRRIKEFSRALAEFDTQLLAEDRKVENLKEELGRATTRKAALAAEIHRLELDRVRLEHEQLSADSERERLTQSVRALEQEQSDFTAAVQMLDEQIQVANATVQGRLQERAEREHQLDAVSTQLTEVRKSAEALDAAVVQSRVRNAALGEKKENTFHNLENRRQLHDETLVAMDTHQGQITDIRRRRADIEKALAESERSRETRQKQLREMEERLQEDRQRYRTVSMGLAELEESIKEWRPQGEACQEEKNRVQLALAEKRLSLQHLADTIHDKYDVDITQIDIPLSNETPSREDLIAEIEELRARLDRMGEVNLAAIGEYEELTTRFEFMSRQQQDLEKSMADLQQTIVKLNRICRLRFKESFEEINAKFEAVFPRLFRGGKAKLLLTDESDYLETGVEIVVQPPGKKLQSITLLSGGEKALTAVSLLFAIFLTKPSPFCFLDEVDAPLDDANIDRFNDLIKEMSQFSQFVLVTHNKKTMQAGEMLYGITMAEPGASKVVSVRMS